MAVSYRLSARVRGQRVLVSYSLVGSDDGVWPGEGNRNADPLFVRNGRRDDAGTPDDPDDDLWIDGDYHLSPGSPAIDAGSDERAPIVDLDGRPRPCLDHVDLGAFEAGRRLPGFFVRGDADDSGVLDLTDPIVALHSQFFHPPPCVEALDFDDNGRFEITDPIAELSFLFLGGSPPPAPYPACGFDPTPDDRNGNGVAGEPDDDLGCLEYTACE